MNRFNNIQEVIDFVYSIPEDKLIPNELMDIHDNSKGCVIGHILGHLHGNMTRFSIDDINNLLNIGITPSKLVLINNATPDGLRKDAVLAYLHQRQAEMQPKHLLYRVIP